MTCSRLACLAALVAFPVGALSAQQRTPERCTGRWEGTIDLPNAKLAFDIDLRRNANGECGGDISIPQQGANDVALTNLLVSGDSLRVTISGIAGSPTLAGVRSADGRVIRGTFTQGAGAFPFVMNAALSAADRARASLVGFDKWIDSARVSWRAAGLSVGITVGGETVYLEGHGERDRERKLPVTPQTLFAIGSSSKAFTTFAMGALVDEGKLQWDVPVRTYIPWFRMHDDVATLRLTPRDLVTHRSGLPRHDLLWYNNSTASREELVRRLAYLPLSRDIRTTFQYNNLMFLTAGYLVGEINKTTWEQGLRELVLDPLGMKRSNFSVKQSEADPNHAKPYELRGDTIRRVPFRDISLVGPAGSINSTAEEMLQWVNLHLAQGKRGDKQVIQQSTLRDMYRPYTPISGMGNDAELGPSSYGLGWFVDTYRGRLRVQHGGNIDGFTAAVQMLPAQRIGIVVLVNQNASQLGELVSRHAMDRLLGETRRDWSAEALRRRDASAQAARLAPPAKTAARIANTRPAHTLAQYAGTFADSGYGNLQVALVRDTLQVTYNGIMAPLEHWHYETFAGLRNPADAALENVQFTFRTATTGRVDAVVVQMDPLVPPVAFLRQPEPRFREVAYLQPFAARYRNPALEITIAVRNGVLVWVQGNTATELLPEELNRFSVKGQRNSYVEFLVDASGKVTAARAIQSGAVLEFTRVP
jgi:CubicO group peptidase (beta-lactamase class C family)